MQHWTWWLSGLALAFVPVLNWLVVRRLMAVSGRYTALVDRIRLGPQEELDMSEEELIRALQAATADAFEGDPLAGAAIAEPGPTPPAVGAGVRLQPARTPLMHVVFLGSLVVGGLLSAALAGDMTLSFGLKGSAFSEAFGTATWTMPLVLTLGGVLVGFGTRMAAGCTSGHGLCGVSRGQAGSVAATAAFFAAGVATSLALGWL